MSRNKYLFISDLHLGMGHSWDWFPYKKNEAHLIAFLDWVASREDVAELVLLGDIFDNWVWPHDQGSPPSLEEVISCDKNRLIMDALRRVAASPVRLSAVEGNHDMGLSKTSIVEQIPGLILQERFFIDGPIHAEHGHHHTLVNAPDPVGRDVPLGYWVTRILTRTAGPEIDSFKILRRVIGEVLEAVFTKQTLPESILETVMEAAGMDEGSLISIQEGESVSCGEIKQRYRLLLEEWGDEWEHRLMADMDCLETVAEEIANRQHYRIVLFGHTHKPTTDKDWIGFDHIYANTGTWRHEDQRDFVEVTQGIERVELRLCKWRDHDSCKVIAHKSVKK